MCSQAGRARLPTRRHCRHGPGPGLTRRAQASADGRRCVGAPGVRGDVAVGQVQQEVGQGDAVRQGVAVGGEPVGGGGGAAVVQQVALGAQLGGARRAERWASRRGMLGDHGILGLARNAGPSVGGLPPAPGQPGVALPSVGPELRCPRCAHLAQQHELVQLLIQAERGLVQRGDDAAPAACRGAGREAAWAGRDQTFGERQPCSGQQRTSRAAHDVPTCQVSQRAQHVH